VWLADRPLIPYIEARMPYPMKHAMAAAFALLGAFGGTTHAPSSGPDIAH